MARGVIPVTGVNRSGVLLPNPTTGDAINKHTVENNGRVVLLVENTGSTVARTVSFHLARTVDGFSVTPRTVSVSAGDTKACGPFNPNDYGDDLLVDVDNAELKITAIRV
ncbi:hypothetical protein [Streptomyces graminilatus]|uniref:hypothetical protein n=1 Tax=Streptomyces graminilatus TaxID=1464070 RepID=UPI0006E1C99D|nr:hypothetical protein [Streptomyces graminilatus]